MTIRDERRQAAIDLMADHLLQQGLGRASLRHLAAAAGTSDRMLLYYFADRDELLAVTLERVAVRLAGLLDAAVPAEANHQPGVLLGRLWSAMTSPVLQPFMHLWLELAAGAARGLQPHRAVAGRIADGFMTWIATRLAGASPDRVNTAPMLLAALEGLLVLDAIDRRAVANLAAGIFASFTPALDAVVADGTIREKGKPG